jgi:hypothetical protein
MPHDEMGAATKLTAAASRSCTRQTVPNIAIVLPTDAGVVAKMLIKLAVGVAITVILDIAGVYEKVKQVRTHCDS